MQIGVLGAGAIGCYIGGSLQRAGHAVTLIGRPRVLDPIREHGLALRDLDGEVVRIAAETLRCAEDPRALADCDLVLVACKGNDTERAARELVPVLRPDGAVVSLQNGVDNPRVLASILGSERVFGGIVSWNVVWQGGELARMTSGPVIVERRAGARGDAVATMVKSLDRIGIKASDHPEIERVLWSKLLFNLNNAINALLGITLAEELADRRCRQLIATTMREGLAVMARAGIRPLRLGRMSPELSVRVLPLPDAVFKMLSRSMLKVGSDARSSMYADLALGKATEIEFLNGAVVRLGKEHDVPTPVNQRIVDEIKRAERLGKGSPRLSVAELGG